MNVLSEDTFSQIYQLYCSYIKPGQVFAVLMRVPDHF